MSDARRDGLSVLTMFKTDQDEVGMVLSSPNRVDC